MTAPNTETQGPNVEGLDAFEQTIQSTMHEVKPIIAADQPVTDRPRDAQGKFVSQAEGVDANGNPSSKPAGEWNVIPDGDTPAGQPTGEAPPEGEAPKPAIPDGYVAPQALAPEKVQGFKVFDAEGEVVPPDLKFEVNFRGPNGEVRPRTFDLPKLINFARQGEYNYERDQRTIAVSQENHGLQQRVAEYDQGVRQLRQERERLLSDPDYLLSQLSDFERQNTPEARAQRERDQIEHDRQELTFQQVSRDNLSFLDNDVSPALETIAKALPTVTLDEVAARLAQMIEPFKVRTPFGTVIHPQYFQRVQQAVLDLVPWAQQVHSDREDRQPPKTPVPPKALAPTADAEKIRNAKLRRQVAAAIRPAGGDGRIQSPPTQQKTPTTNRGMEDMVISRSLAGATGRSG